MLRLLSVTIFLILIGCSGTMDRIYVFRGGIISDDKEAINKCRFSLIDQGGLPKEDVLMDEEINGPFLLTFFTWKEYKKLIVEISCGDQYLLFRSNDLDSYLNGGGEYDFGEVRLKRKFSQGQKSPK